MQPNLSYVKDRLLSAGRHLQKGIATLEDGETYRTMHDAQNQLALALATIVHIQHGQTSEVVTYREDGLGVTASELVRLGDRPVTHSEPATNTVQLIALLRNESQAKINDTRSKYTAKEQGILLRAAAMLESVHPSLLDVD
jgi:hypothetical protein